MASRTDIDEADENLAAARWVMAIEEGLDTRQTEAFHAWLAERPERAELIARQAALQSLAAEPPTPDAQSRRGFLLGGAITAGAVAMGGAALIVRAPPADEVSAYQTATGEVRAIELSDASRLWLDTRTDVFVRLTRGQRNVTLNSGRVFVEVAHAPERPFIVRGAQFEARAIGTAFEVTAFPGRTGVAVREGVVRLKARHGAPIDLAAGESAWIAASGEVTRVSASAPTVAAWRERRMVLSDRRLDEALSELSRYFDRPLIVSDESLAARRVSLSFSLADMNEEEAARIIASAVEADVADRASAGMLLSPAPLAP